MAIAQVPQKPFKVDRSPCCLNGSLL